MNKKRRIFTRNTKSNIIVVCVGVLLFMALFNLSAVTSFIGFVWGIVSPFFVAIVFAFLLNMPMRFFERHVFKKCKPKTKRLLSLIVTYALALIVIGVLLGLVVPQIVDSVARIVNNIERYLHNFNDMVQQVGGQLGVAEGTLDSFVLSYSDLMKYITDFVMGFVTNTDNWNLMLGFAGQVGNGIYIGVIGFIASIYMLAARDKLLVQCRRLLYAISPKRWADRVMSVFRLSNKIFSGYIGGMLADSALVGVLCFLFMTVMNILSSVLGIASLAMPFSVLISVLIGLTNIIPIFGPFIGAVPSALILLLVNPWGAIWFVIFIVVMQQIDGNIIAPRILGSSTGLPAMWVFIALVVFGGLFGFMGMVLGVPTTAVLYSLGSQFISARLKRKNLMLEDGQVVDGQEAAPLPYERMEKKSRKTVSEAPAAPAPDEAGRAPNDEDSTED